MRSMQRQLGKAGTISAFALGPRETKKNLCLDGRSQDLPDTDLQPAVWRQSKSSNQTKVIDCFNVVTLASLYDIDIFGNCNLVATRWQQYSTVQYSTVHIYTQTIQRTTQNKQYIEEHKHFGRVRAVPRLCGFYAGICLRTEEKARRNLSQGSRRLPAGTMKIYKHTIRIHRHNNKNA